MHADREEMGIYAQKCPLCEYVGLSTEFHPPYDPLEETPYCQACCSYFTKWDQYKYKHKNKNREMSDMFIPVIPTLRTTIKEAWPW